MFYHPGSCDDGFFSSTAAYPMGLSMDLLGGRVWENKAFGAGQTLFSLLWSNVRCINLDRLHKAVLSLGFFVSKWMSSQGSGGPKKDT